MSYPKNYLYSKDHEWVLEENGICTVGITDFAQSELGEIVFIELPKVGKEVSPGQTVCVIESTKAASDVYSPINGIVKEVNEGLLDNPSLINSDPHSSGWILKVENYTSEALRDLLPLEQYEKLIGK